jgi:GTP-binding protein HflX
LYNRRVPIQDLVAPQLARSLAELSRDTGRRIGLLIDRMGEVDKVVVGEAHRVFLPDLGARRAGAARFRGLRLILVGPRPGLAEDDLTDLILLQLDAVVAIQAMHDGLPGPVTWAHLLPPDSPTPHRVETLPSIHAWNADFSDILRDLEGQFTRSPHLKKIQDREGAILVGLTLGNPRAARRSLGELERLADTAGYQVLEATLQNRPKLDGRTCVGSGKLEELIVRSMRLGASALVFDRELSPSQLRNIAEKTELRVLDRTQLILDIFAQHAQSREGKLQVELAQLRYRMPRLAIMPTAMSRLTGGIGGRGPGETKLEINKRRALERVTRLERELEELASNRALRRKRRMRHELPVVSIVGYTNAGKSTLLNRMTHSSVLVADQLFATLDPTSRRFRFPEEREIILTDTVGFIEGLPDTLVKAFMATLEELEDADLLLHVLDASDDEAEHHKGAVDEVVKRLELEGRPTVIAWNKAEIADPVLLRERIDRYGGIPISALTGQGLEELLTRLEAEVFRARAARQPVETDTETP